MIKRLRLLFKPKPKWKGNKITHVWIDEVTVLDIDGKDPANAEWDLPWVPFLGRRCAAVKTPNRRGPDYSGQCELVRDHHSWHAISRDGEVVRWSTEEFIFSPIIDEEMRRTLARIVDSVTDYPPFLEIVVDDLMRYFENRQRAIAYKEINDGKPI